MSIKTGQISTQGTGQRNYLVLTMTEERPILGELPIDVTIDHPAQALIGWYNAASDMVEIYMVNSFANRYIRVATLPY